RNIAEERREIALARQLAAQAELTRTSYAPRLQQSVLLAVESLKRFASFEADQALRAGLVLLPPLVMDVALEGRITETFIHPAGQYLITISDDSVSRIWDLRAKQETARVRHGSAIVAAVLSPEGAQQGRRCEEPLKPVLCEDLEGADEHEKIQLRVIRRAAALYRALTDNALSTRRWDSAAPMPLAPRAVTARLLSDRAWLGNGVAS